MKLPRPKKKERAKKAQKRAHLFRFILAVFVLIALAILAYRAWGAFSEATWDGQTRLTLALATQPVLLVSFDPDEDNLVVLTIPSRTLLETAHGYGPYQAGVVWRLGELENRGGQLLAESLQGVLGLAVDGWVLLGDERAGIRAEEDLKEFWPDSCLALLKGRGQTNLTNWDLLRLWWHTRGLRGTQVDWIDLAETRAVEEKVLADETRVLMVNQLYLDPLMAELFSDSKISQEGLSIGVYNSSSYPGLANQAARLVNNLGGQVVETGDWEEPLTRCLVYASEKNRQTLTVKRLLAVFGCDFFQSEAPSKKAEVFLVLGEDYRLKFEPRQ